MAGTELTMALSVDSPMPKVLRERQGGHSVVTFELCRYGCFMPVLAGHEQEHLAVVQHRMPPMAAETPEG